MSAFFADMSFISIRLARRTSSSRVRSGTRPIERR